MDMIIKYQQQNNQDNQDRIHIGKQYKRLQLNNMDIEFTFSPNSKDQISVFEMNTITKQFSKTRDIPVKSGSKGNARFPQQYINKKCILLSKNGEYVNLVRKYQHGDFLTEQSIHFGTNFLYGVMSDDGEYLITWNDKQSQIQILEKQRIMKIQIQTYIFKMNQFLFSKILNCDNLVQIYLNDWNQKPNKQKFYFSNLTSYNRNNNLFSETNIKQKI